MPYYLNMIETINHFKEENENSIIFLFEVQRQPYFHKYMMECLIHSINKCLTSSELIFYEDYDPDNFFDYEDIDEVKQYLTEAICNNYGVIDELNLSTEMKKYNKEKEGFDNLFESLNGLDMISLIQELQVSYCDEFEMMDFDASYCFGMLCDIYIENFINYHEQTKEQHSDLIIWKIQEFLNETCLNAFHSPHTEIGKKQVEKLYKELQDLE